MCKGERMKREEGGEKWEMENGEEEVEVIGCVEVCVPRVCDIVL